MNDKSVGILLQQLASSLSRQSDEILQAKLDISFSKYKILRVLQLRPYIRQKEIARELNQTEASISRQIRLMFEDGLLQVRQRSEDKRAHSTVLTPRGERIVRQATKLLNSLLSSIFENVSIKEQQALKVVLEQAYLRLQRS